MTGLRPPRRLSRHQVLVRVKAAGVGPWDAWIREGKHSSCVGGAVFLAEFLDQMDD